MTGDDFRRRTDAVRPLPLQCVLTRWGAERDRCDRARWHTERGPVSVRGAKFFNWQRNEGGGGAIDLVMHLGEMDVRAAVAWLEQQLGARPVASSSTANSTSDTCLPAASSHAEASAQTCRQLRLPEPQLTNFSRVRRYLTEQRSLAQSILEPLIDAGKIYADRRGNAVFLMVAGKANRPIGAELRGTGKRVWRGLARGTRKDAGYFWIGARGSKKIVLCESAIDAISCFQLNSPSICISTAGVRSDPPWLHRLLALEYNISCGFDDDEPGNAAADTMIQLHPSIQRLRPPAHDWNDALINGQ